ncbi:MAG: hypothetical protein JSU68_05795 [Phycisphaerales bacterium]|nr:MAG: hypothetical protein JSU68_05795 [Phycisphaerales bacterium]
MAVKRKKKAAKGRKKKAKKAGRKAKRKVAKKAKKRKAPRKKTAKKKTVKRKKRKPNPAFMKALTPSAELAAVVGAKPLPRTQVIKKLWAYIKRNGLQDAKNRRMVNADAKLKPIFRGKKQVSMFQMTALVSKHLT